MLCDRLHVSERWACRVCGQHRSTQRREPTPAGDDEALRVELRAFSARRPRWGYRQAHTHLQQQGWEINRKRVQRVWREEGCVSRSAPASAAGSATPPRPRSSFVPSAPGTCGRLTSSLTRPPTAVH
jgi:putative transposase